MFKKYQSQIPHQVTSQIKKGLKEFMFKRRFSTSGTLANLDTGSASLKHFEMNRAVFEKLIEKDLSYFTKMQNEKGSEYTLKELEKVSSNVDLSTKVGREIAKAKNEIVTRLAYQERSIEEHEHLSNHICEGDLYKVYAEHLKQLEEKAHNIDYLVEKSNPNSQLLYEYRSNFFSTKYFLSPFLIFAVPSILTYKYKLLVINVLGGFAPSLIYAGAFYAALKSNKMLSAGSSIQGSKLVKSLRLNGSILEINSSNFMGSQVHRLSLSSTTIEFIGHEYRKEAYYAIKDAFNKNIFIMPVDENSIIDHKTIGMLGQLKNETDEYSIKGVLTKGNQKLINFTMTASMRREIEQMARIQLLGKKEGDIAKLNPNELTEKLNSISDREVSDYLNGLKSEMESSIPSIESSLVSVENLFTSFGLSSEKAASVTQYLRQNYQISGVGDIASLSRNELKRAFNEAASNSKVDLKTFILSIEAFFNNLTKK